jgi:hypothetical protein
MICFRHSADVTQCPVAWRQQQCGGACVRARISPQELWRAPALQLSARRFQDLFIAPAVQAATQDHRDEMDIIGRFIRDCVEPAEGETVRSWVVLLCADRW